MHLDHLYVKIMAIIYKRWFRDFWHKCEVDMCDTDWDSRRALKSKFHLQTGNSRVLIPPPYADVRAMRRRSFCPFSNGCFASHDYRHTKLRQLLPYVDFVFGRYIAPTVEIAQCLPRTDYSQASMLTRKIRVHVNPTRQKRGPRKHRESPRLSVRNSMYLQYSCGLRPSLYWSNGET